MGLAPYGEPKYASLIYERLMDLKEDGSFKLDMEYFDYCSGLTMMAERAAGVSIPRTSQQQWADLPHVPASQAGPGDLALFVGSDGTWTAPGHVAIVINHHGGIVEAYGTGVPVRYSTDHRSDLVGFVKP